MFNFKLNQYILGALSLLALWSVIPVSYATWQSVNPCPNVGPLPACYLVTLGYLFILISSFTKQKVLFYTGWLPVFALASFGSGLEFFKSNICPKTGSGIPMCYLSLALALICLALFTSFSLKRKSK